jgi:hypothetical protein
MTDTSPSTLALAEALAIALGHTGIFADGKFTPAPNTLRIARDVENFMGLLGWRIVEDDPDHFVTFEADGWFIEHTLSCHLAGTLGTCIYNTVIREVYDGPPDPADFGRWRITEIDEEGMPSLERCNE